MDKIKMKLKELVDDLHGMEQEISEIAYSIADLTKDNISDKNLLSTLYHEYKVQIEGLDHKYSRLSEPKEPKSPFSTDEEEEFYLDVATKYIDIKQQIDNLEIELDMNFEDLFYNALRLRRINTLTKIMNKVNRMTISAFMEHVEFNDRPQVERWVLDLPDKYPIYLEGEDIVVDRIRMNSETELNSMIDELIDNFQQLGQDNTKL